MLGGKVQGAADCAALAQGAEVKAFSLGTKYARGEGAGRGGLRRFGAGRRGQGLLSRHEIRSRGRCRARRTAPLWRRAPRSRPSLSARNTLAGDVTPRALTSQLTWSKSSRRIG